MKPTHGWTGRNGSRGRREKCCVGARKKYELAERWLEAVWNTVFFLRDHPEAGRLRRDLRHAGVRSWLVADFRRWTIFYRIKRLEGGERDLRALAVA